MKLIKETSLGPWSIGDLAERLEGMSESEIDAFLYDNFIILHRTIPPNTDITLLGRIGFIVLWIPLATLSFFTWMFKGSGSLLPFVKNSKLFATVFYYCGFE